MATKKSLLSLPWELRLQIFKLSLKRDGRVALPKTFYDGFSNLSWFHRFCQQYPLLAIESTNLPTALEARRMFFTENTFEVIYEEIMYQAHEFSWSDPEGPEVWKLTPRVAIEYDFRDLMRFIHVKVSTTRTALPSLEDCIYRLCTKFPNLERITYLQPFVSGGYTDLKPYIHGSRMLPHHLGLMNLRFSDAQQKDLSIMIDKYRGAGICKIVGIYERFSWLDLGREDAEPRLFWWVGDMGTESRIMIIDAGSPISESFWMRSNRMTVPRSDWPFDEDCLLEPKGKLDLDEQERNIYELAIGCIVDREARLPERGQVRHRYSCWAYP